MSCVAEAVGDQKRADRDEQRRDRRIADSPRSTIAAISKSLRQQQPAAAPAEAPRQERNVERVDQRRPEEFDGVGRADQREQADGAEIDAGLASSTTSSVEPDERERQAATKSRAT